MSVPEHLRRKRRALLEVLQRAGAEKATLGPSAARSQDFLYDELGLPVGWDSRFNREGTSATATSSEREIE